VVLLPVLIAIVMLASDRYGLQSFFMRTFGQDLSHQGYTHTEIAFFSQVYFSSLTFILFVFVPMAFHFIFPVRRADGASSLGLSVRYCLPHLPIYALLLVIMVPVLWIVSFTPSFQQFYPLYKPTSLGIWLLFETVYLAQFFCVEFFFRGFSLFRLQNVFGYHAVAMMVIPYALLHIHKPFPEALASIVAGLVLGWLALKSRSIWPGVVVHGGVAFCMDWFSLINSGRMAAL